jgi:hypothetical protein
VHPKTAQALARHSTITLAMDRYSHVRNAELAPALNALPDLDKSAAESARDRECERFCVGALACSRRSWA